MLLLFSPQKKIRPVWWCGRIVSASKKAREKKRARRNGKFGESSSSSKARFVRRTFFLERRIKGRENSPLCFFFVIKFDENWRETFALLRDIFSFFDDEKKTMDGRDDRDDTAALLKEQEEKLRAKYGGMIPKKNLIVSDKKHFDSADWSRSRQLGVVSSAGGDGAEFCDDEEILKPVLGAKDVPGTSPPSDASTFTTTNTSSKTKRRTSMDESRGRWDMNATTNTTVNSAYHAPAGASSGGK